MQCPQCRHENAASVKFCGECGARLQSVCPSCQASNPPTNKFCQECGVRLAAATPPATAVEPAATASTAAPVAAGPSDDATSLDSKYSSPQAYTPKHLAEKILTSKSALEGERKRVTVMFVDVCGFTTISERLDPEDVHAIMDRAFEMMLEAVHRHEGTINQFLGDGIMALFGAPIAHEDHPHRGLSAALAISEGLKPLQADVQRMHGVEFRVRMGLNTGMVVVGAIGRDLRMDYTAVGDTTNLAARLMSLAKPGQIVVSRWTQHLRERFFRWEELGEFQVKGKSEAVRAYALIDQIRGRTSLEVSREGGLTTLIGREDELATLLSLASLAQEGRGAVALISGEPGVGKSRLLYEFLRAVETGGSLQLEASCVAYGRAIPYRPILELVRDYLGLLEEMTEDEVRLRAEKGLLELGIEGDEPATLLAHFLGAPAPAAFVNRLGAQIKGRTFAVLHDLFVAASESTSLVVVVENIHWIDPTSEEFLAFLARDVPNHRLMLVLTTRPDDSPSILAACAGTSVVLGGLEPEQLRSMVTSLAHAERVSDDLFRILLEKSAGNPLYIEEILRQLQETNGLTAIAGELRLTSAGVTVPATIHDIIAARIDRLPDELKRLLQGAAVIGRRFSVSLLSRLLAVPGEAVESLLAELHRLDFIFRSGDDPETMYSFKHALTQDVVYSSVLERRRREYHGAAARGLEDLYAGRIQYVVELVAYHFRRAQVWDRAAIYLRQAAIKAEARSVYQQAVAYLEDALEALRHVSPTSETREQEIDVHLELRGSLYRLGEFEKMLAHLREAETAAAAISDSRRLGLVSIHTAEYCRQTGRFAEAKVLAEQAFALAEGLQDSTLRLYSSHYLGLACHGVGEYRRASAMLRAVVDSPSTAFKTGAFGMVGTWTAYQAINLAWLARCLAELGEFGEGLDAGRRAVALADEADSPYTETAACIGLGYVALVKGDLDIARQALERACRVARDADLALLRPQANRLLGSAYLLAGRIDEGAALVQTAAEEVERRGLSMQQVAVVALFGEMCLFRDRVDEASVAAQRAVALARERGQRGDLAVALRVLGDASARLLVVDEAEGHYVAAITLAAELEMRPELARGHLGIGRLYLRTGDRRRAEDHLLRAMRLFSAIEMTLWLRQVGTSLSELGRVLIVASNERPLYDHLTGAFPPGGPLDIRLDSPARHASKPDDESDQYIDTMLRSHGLSIIGE